MKVLVFVFSFCFLFLSLSPAQAASFLDVVINEIAWMGTKVSYNDEWIELYNNTDSAINLDGWVLKSADETPVINLTGEIPAKGFYLLERTDDNTVPDISAEQIYTGSLSNSGEDLKLYDNSGNLIDSVNSGSGWFAGDNSTKQTMERINSDLLGTVANNWGNSQNPNGTPKVKNSVTTQSTEKPIAEPESQPETKVAEIKSPQTEEAVIYPSSIVINEILPSPIGLDETDEWIEIFNGDSFEVNLAGWQITDTAGAVKTYNFPGSARIAGQSFLVLLRPETKITLNNDGDGLKLIRPDGKVVDSVDYEKAPRGQSYNRTVSGWSWSNILTPISANVISSFSETTKGSDSEKEPSEPEGLAQIFQEKTTGNKSFLLFLSAPILAIFSGAVILLIKRKLKTDV